MSGHATARTAPAVPGPDARRRALDVVLELVVRDVRLRYRRSVLGIAWSQLGPLVTLAVLSFVFTEVVPLGIDDFVAFAFVGLLAWTWVVGALPAAAGSLVANRDLVMRPGLSPALLPVTTVVTHGVQLLLSVPVLLVAVVWDTGLPGPEVLVLPLVVLLQLALLTGPALALAAWNVRYRDVGHLVGVVLMPLFWATPVFYDPASVPERFRTLYELNPLVHLVAAYRAPLLDGRLPPAGGTLYLVVLSAVLLAGGVLVFRRRAPDLPDEL